MSQFKIINGMELFDLASVSVVNPPKGVMLEGWDEFNEFTGGLRPSEFTIFCGGTGIGKTQWLANLVAKLVKQNVKTFCAPVETGPEDLGRRIFSVLGNHDFNAGYEPSAEMKSNLMHVMKTNMETYSNNLLVSTYDDRVDINEMIETLKFVHDVHGVQVALLDNLNFFMKPVRASEQILEYDEVIHRFVMLAKQLPVHVILVMHPKKTDGKILSEFDIKGSSTAVQEASNVLLMNRLDEDELVNGKDLYDREFVFRKIRRRGFYVGRKFYMRSKHGRYIASSATGNFKVPQGSGTGFRDAKTSGPKNFS